MSTAPKVRERAIRFTDDEVRKLLGMPEVLLYRPIKLHQFHRSTTPGYDWQFRDKQGRWQDYREAELVAERCPYGKPGDRLWVQETLWISECGGYFARDTYRPCEVMREVFARDGSRRWRVRGDGERIGEGDYTDTVVGWGNHGRDVGRGDNRRWVPAFDQSFVGGIEPSSSEHPYGKTIDRREAMFRKHWPATQMPRWASRLTFEIEHVGVQCLCSEDLWVLSLRRLEVAK